MYPFAHYYHPVLYRLVSRANSVSYLWWYLRRKTKVKFMKREKEADLLTGVMRSIPLQMIALLPLTPILTRFVSLSYIKGCLFVPQFLIYDDSMLWVFVNLSPFDIVEEDWLLCRFEAFPFTVVLLEDDNFKVSSCVCFFWLIMLKVMIFMFHSFVTLFLAWWRFLAMEERRKWF